METTKTIFSTIKSRKIKCDHCKKEIMKKKTCYTINVIKGTGGDNESGEIISSIFCEKCYQNKLFTVYSDLYCPGFA
jgi:hypothetical protein